jgi:hypothetical protein
MPFILYIQHYNFDWFDVIWELLKSNTWNIPGIENYLRDKPNLSLDIHFSVFKNQRWFYLHYLRYLIN